MTDRELSTLLREHVRGTEPPLDLDPGAVILAGRRILRRRRLRRGAAALVIGTAAAVAVPFTVGGDAGSSGIDPATESALEHYDPDAMPGVLHRAIGPAVNRAIPGIAQDRAFSAYDDQGERIPRQHWDKASEMEISYGGEGPHRVRLALLHARSEAEGDAREYCRDELASGYAFRCFVSTEDGDVVKNLITAVRPFRRPGGGWAAITRGELRSGVILPSNANQDPLDRDEVYFVKTVESVHSDTFLTVAQEIVKAPDLARANAAWGLADLLLDRVVSDPTLVMPEPPQGPGGCGWTWKAEVTCAKTRELG